MSQKLYESYEWMVPFDTSTIQGKKVIIRGKAIHATVSANVRKYVEQEMVEFGRTLAGKYVDVNHEYSLWMKQKRAYDAGEVTVSPGPKPKLKGNVIDSQYNHENGFVEYVGEVNHPEYAQKLIDRERMTLEAYQKKWGKPPIRYVSIDANYRFHRETDGGIEPHGIIGNGLSMVEWPETPGVEGTSVEVMEIRETQQLDAQLHVLQRLCQDKGVLTEVVERDGHKTLQEIPMDKTLEETDEARAKHRFKFSDDEWDQLTAEVRLTYLNKIHEQDDTMAPGSQYCMEHPDDPRCVQHRDTIHGEEQAEPCPEGQHRNEAGDCVPDAPVTEQEAPCPEGQHRNADGECVPDAPQPAPETLTTPTPITLPTLEALHLGEPFADYTSFDDCVAKNQDKDDPEAYCASIQRQVEGETLQHKLHDVKLQHRVVTLGKSVAHIASRQEQNSNMITDAFAKLSERDTQIVEMLRGAVTSLTDTDGKLTKTCIALAAKMPDMKPITDAITALRETYTSFLKDVTDKLAMFDAKITKVDTVYADKFSGIDEKLASFDHGEAQLTEMRGLFKKYQDEKQQGITETASTMATMKQSLDAVTVRLDNVEEKLKKPQFTAGATDADALPSSPLHPTGRLDPTLG